MVLEGIPIHFGPQNQVFCVSPLGSFSDPNRGHFLDTFFLRIGTLLGPLGSALGPPEALLERAYKALKEPYKEFQGARGTARRTAR